MKLTDLIRWRLGIVGVAMVLVSALWAVRVRAQAEPFYKGKQIRIITGATAGGFYDRWGRLLARAMPKYIPGQPDIIVQNMPGAGSLVALNYINGVAKPDGLATVMPNSNVYLEQLSGHKEVRFDLRKFSTIGSQEKNYMVLYMRARRAVQDHRRHHQSQRSAEVRQHWRRQRRICSRPGSGRGIWRENQHRDGLSGRQRDRPGGGKGRDTMPRQHHITTFWTRAL